MTQLLFLSIAEIRIERSHYQADKWDLETEINIKNSMW